MTIESTHSCQCIITGGDFNLVLDQDLDTMNCKKKTLKNLENKFNMLWTFFNLLIPFGRVIEN